MCGQRILKSACEEALHPWLSKMLPMKILIRLCEFASSELNLRWAHMSEGTFSYVVAHLALPSRKHAYSNILKILLPKNEKFQIKNSDIFHVSAQNRLWILVRTASARRF